MVHEIDHAGSIVAHWKYDLITKKLHLSISSFPWQNETTSEVYVGSFGLHNSNY